MLYSERVMMPLKVCLFGIYQCSVFTHIFGLGRFRPNTNCEFKYNVLAGVAPKHAFFLLHPFIYTSILIYCPQFGISCSKLLGILAVFKRFVLKDSSNFGRRQFLRYKLTPFIPFPPTSSLLSHVSRCSNYHFTKPGNIKLFDLMF
jgi:hypothetical protein